MKELVERIIRALVDNPDQVEISEMESQQTTIIEVKVAKEDVGKIIGKQGRTAHAIRTLVNAGSAKYNKRIVLEILE